MKNYGDSLRQTLDRIPSLPIIPPDMVTFLHMMRDFLFEPLGLMFSFAF